MIRDMMRQRQRPAMRRICLVALALAAAAAAGCRGDASAVEEAGAEQHEAEEAAVTEKSAEEAGPAPAGPYVRVVGTVQDGGLPHAACNCVRCERARHDPAQRRRVASLAVVMPGSGKVFLLDATPDVRQQIDLLSDLRDPPEGRVDRAPVDGVLLTHAHLGHYLGLAFFGFEAIHSRDLPVYCTPKMADFLRRNGPWSQLVEMGNVELMEVPPGREVALGDGVRVGFLRVPHRDEYSDTVGFVVRGPRRSLLYVPDTYAWRAWETPLTETLRDIDVAILDGSFYSLDELPGRDITAVKHPLITVSMDLLQETVDAGQAAVYFSHMNHTNPALEPHSAARHEIERRGFHVLAEGQELEL